MNDDDANMDSRKPKQAGAKRIGFALPEERERMDLHTGDAKKRRGTPHPMKRTIEDYELLPLAGMPPPQFNRTASAVLAGIPPHDPHKLVSFEDDEGTVSWDDFHNSLAPVSHMPAMASWFAFFRTQFREAIVALNGSIEAVDPEYKHDEDAEDEEGLVYDESEEDKEWAIFVAKKKENGITDFTLERFLRGQENWKEAHEKLETAYEDFGTQMGDKIQGLVDLFTAIYKQRQSQLNELQAECEGYLIENHRRRNEAVDILQKSNKKWKSHYEIMIARTLDEEEPAMVDCSGDEPGEVGFVLHRFM
jgi:hypothetical protein